MTVDRCIAAAIDHAGAVRVDLQPVAVTPNRPASAAVEIVRIGLEITGAITLVALVVPEPQRHRGQGLGADELADFAGDSAAVLVESLDRAAEQPALHRARRLRQLAIAADEGAGEIGAAADIGPPHVPLRLA